MLSITIVISRRRFTDDQPWSFEMSHDYDCDDPFFELENLKLDACNNVTSQNQGKASSIQIFAKNDDSAVGKQFYRNSLP